MQEVLQTGPYILLSKTIIVSRFTFSARARNALRPPQFSQFIFLFSFHLSLSSLSLSLIAN